VLPFRFPRLEYLFYYLPALTRTCELVRLHLPDLSFVRAARPMAVGVVRGAVLLPYRHAYGVENLAAPHSKQRGFSRDVINPQDGHILCDRNPAPCGLSLPIQ
jgi:hypothetical protein